jgi:CheY-like chemotaxis protein
MEPRILIASNDSGEAESCRKLLQDEFDNIVFSTEAISAVEDFEAAKPNVIILAFKELEAAERYYLGLYRLSQTIHAQVHRTITLCTKDNVRDIYKLCRQGHFDDYVLFWPLTYDVPRLAMAVHQAMRVLSNPGEARALQEKMVPDIERIAALESIVNEQFDQHEASVDSASKSLKRGELQIAAAINGFWDSLFVGELADAVEIKEPAALRTELRRLKSENVRQSFRLMDESVESMRSWSGSVKKELGPCITSARRLAEISERSRPLVLIVDDDEYQRKILGAMLAKEKLDLIFAVSGIDALTALRRHRPDLILMDYEMPEVNGVEVVQRLKASEAFGSIPIIMLTGMSDRSVVSDSLEAGADDFIVKPAQREVLLKKLARFLDRDDSSPIRDDTPQPATLDTV